MNPESHPGRLSPCQSTAPLFTRRHVPKAWKSSWFYLFPPPTHPVLTSYLDRLEPPLPAFRLVSFPSLSSPLGRAKVTSRQGSAAVRRLPARPGVRCRPLSRPWSGTARLTPLQPPGLAPGLGTGSARGALRLASAQGSGSLGQCRVAPRRALARTRITACLSCLSSHWRALEAGYGGRPAGEARSPRTASGGPAFNNSAGAGRVRARPAHSTG